LILIGRHEMNDDIQLVVFDLFGTLLQSGSGHHPYRKVLEWARSNGRAPRPNDATTIMTADKSPDELFDTMGISPTAEIMSIFNRALEADIKSIRLFDDSLSTLRRLAKRGVEIAICSNLAKPYGAALKLIEEVDYIRCLSYEIGAIKPDPAVYSYIINTSSHLKEHVLFIGDSLVADYKGPTEFGFGARHLVRIASSRPVAAQENLITSLNDIFHL
jgi:HAD superfamily hydrolase (TIGR01549 family)